MDAQVRLVERSHTEQAGSCTAFKIELPDFDPGRYEVSVIPQPISRQTFFSTKMAQHH